MNRVLVLAGTTEASLLADRLVATGADVVSSLAGVTSSPRKRPGRVRTGGFGGAAGLARYLIAEGIDALIDATHPFAARMPFHAAIGADAAGIPRCRLLRPPWMPTDGDRWIGVPSVDAAPSAVRALGARRVLLTVGRQSTAAFGSATGLDIVARSIEAPLGLPARATILLDRGPFNVDDERRLLVEYRIDAIVTKNSGGSATAAKLVAARSLGLPVVMVSRPAEPGGTVVSTVEAALAWWAETQLGSTRDDLSR